MSDLYHTSDSKLMADFISSLFSDNLLRFALVMADDVQYMSDNLEHFFHLAMHDIPLSETLSSFQTLNLKNLVTFKKLAM